MHRALSGTGAGLMAASFLLALILSSTDPAWAAEHVSLRVALGWLQQAAVVLGASLVAAGFVVVRLAPPPVTKRDPHSEQASDWFA